MIKQIKTMCAKYQEMQKKSEYVSVGQVVNDLYQLLQDARIKRLPKDER